MKKIIAIVCILLFSVTAVLADEVEDNLAGLANEQVMATTRQMIQNGIEKDDAIGMTKLMLQNQFSLQQTLQAQEMLMQALQSGLPAEPLMNKAYEGMTKKVQNRFVLQAMENVRSRYAFAYQKAGQLTEETEEISSLGNMMANALAAGFERGDMDRLMDRLQEMTRTMERKGVEVDELAAETCKTLRDMARLGVSSDAITDVVSEALNQNYTAREMEALRETFMNAAKKGLPEDMAKTYASQMRQSGNEESPSSPGEAGGVGSAGSGGSGETGGSGSDGAGSGGSGSGSSSGNGGGSGEGHK